jgi:hypothetical protein
LLNQKNPIRRRKRRVARPERRSGRNGGYPKGCEGTASPRTPSARSPLANRQDMHAGACQTILVGVYFFRRSRKKYTPTPKRIVRGRSPICVNFSGLPLCKAGVWGIASPQNILFSSFFAAKPRKKKKKTGLGLPPQSHETVTLTPMGLCPLATLLSGV